MPTKTKVWVITERKVTYTKDEFRVAAIYKNEDYAYNRFKKAVDAVTRKEYELMRRTDGDLWKEVMVVYEMGPSGTPRVYNAIRVERKLML